mmetsp:Transcript_2809/g.4001  ORF Transcript_2809/g.4001 Transcript_2809/m.4001 type:complete len:469 (+) Transcript_2809:103-1509(+)
MMKALAIAAISLLSLSGTSAFQLAGLAHAGTKSGVAMAFASRRCPLMRAHTYAHTLTPLPHSKRCGRGGGGGGGMVRKTGAMGMSASVSSAIITTAVIFPAQSIKNSVLPIILVVVLCLLAAIPLGPSLTQKPPELVGTPGSESYEKGARIKKVLGLQKRVFTSVMLGALVSAWIFSGTWGFAAVLCVAGARAQREYYDMAAQANQCRPAKKIGTVALCAMYLTACGTAYGLPFAYTDSVLPTAYLVMVTYLLTLKRPEKMTIADVQTTFMGMFYVGYLSSFWVRLRGLGAIPSDQVLNMMTTGIPLIDKAVMSWAVYISPDVFTQGAVVTWWTMISIAASDVGAYFAGKNFGKTSLADFTGISVSPNKTMEGFAGGVLLCTLFATTGAKLMNWPLWWLSGPFYGIMISTLGLLGDLTVSLFKRDAGVKDTGDLLPGHGGILDRVDSYMLTAAPVYFFVQFMSKMQGF